MDFLHKFKEEISRQTPPRWAPVNLGMDLRSCGCRLLRIDWQGLDHEAWESDGSSLIDGIGREKFPFHVAYLGYFPGSSLIRRLTFRLFCPRCLENYQLEGSVGMNSRIVMDLTSERENCQ